MIIRRGKFEFLIAICLCSLVAIDGQSNSSKWSKKRAEIYFLLDSSSSVWIVDFRKMLRFVADLVSDMDIGPDLTRVGSGVFADNHQMHIPLNNNLNKAQLMDEIMKAPYLKGDTYISRALKSLLVQGLAPSVRRSGFPLIAVLFTDGQSRYKQLTADNATLVKREGINLFTVGIGNAFDPAELRMIASDPKTDHYYRVSDFDHLNDIRSQLSSRMSEVEVLQGDQGTCGDKVNVDTVFVFDEAAIGDNDTWKIKSFIEVVVNNLNVNSGRSRVGVVSKQCREGDITLGQYVTKENFNAGLKIKDAPKIIDLLKRTRIYSFMPENGARSDAKRRIVLILHDNVEKRYATEMTLEAHRASYMNMEIFVIRLGTNYEKSFLRSLVLKESNIIYIDSADDLSKSTSKDKFMNSFCSEI